MAPSFARQITLDGKVAGQHGVLEGQARDCGSMLNTSLPTAFAQDAKLFHQHLRSLSRRAAERSGVEPTLLES